MIRLCNLRSLLRFRAAVSAAMLSACLALPTLSGADDTDLYLNANAPQGGEPLVMFVLDWRPNLSSTVSCDVGSDCDALRVAGYIDDGLGGTGQSSTFFDVLRGVLLRLLDPLGGVKIGFMINHANSNNCEGPTNEGKAGCSNGAYVMQALSTMESGDDDPTVWDTVGEDPDKVALAAKLRAIPYPQGNESHPYQGKEVYFEFFRYLTGQGIYNGHVGNIDYGDSPNDRNNLDVDLPAISWDTAAEKASGNEYKSPLLEASECAKIFMINLLFQVSQNEDDSDTAIKANKNQGGMAGINLSGNRNSFDTVVGYMNDIDLADGTFGDAPDLPGIQNVTSYFIVDPTKINRTTSGYAGAGGTGVPYPLSTNADDLAGALSNIFKSILSVSTTFVAPSVPVNVFNRSQLLNEVYLALFEADADGRPFWPGNLKKLIVGTNATTGVPELQDANGINAIDTDGRIKREAVTFWTEPTLLDPAVDNEVEGADGRSIKRGGAGQKIPSYKPDATAVSLTNSTSTADRRLFTQDPSDTVDGLRPIDDGDTAVLSDYWDELTAEVDGAATSYANNANGLDEAKMAVRYMRGVGPLDATDTTTKRDWMLGDPLHSRPHPINYGARGGYTQTNPDIRILMATTDGQLHMFRNTEPGAGIVHDGSESWSFIPNSALRFQDRLRAGVAGTPVHPVALDGSPVSFLFDNDGDGTVEPTDGDKVYAYIGMRRGGKSYYGLDVTDPDNPKFLWRIGKYLDDGSLNPVYGEFGQTWSTPVVRLMRLGTGDTLTPTPVLIFAAGYNGDDDSDNQGDLGKDAVTRNGSLGTDDDEGRGVFIVNAETGALVWSARYGGTLGYSSGDGAYFHPLMLDSIPAEVTTFDSNGDGGVDLLYFADTGGSLWRADMPTGDPADWTVMKLFNAGRHYDSTLDRRFFSRPDVVPLRDGSGRRFYSILIGSGDRENPKGTSNSDAFFAIRDFNVTSGSPPSTTITPANLANVTIDCVATDTCSAGVQSQLSDFGWMIELESGEKSLAAPITVSGQTLFTTFLPGGTTSACELSEGSGRVYRVATATGTAVFNYDLSNDSEGYETFERFDTLASGGIPVEVVSLGDGYLLIQGARPSGASSDPTNQCGASGNIVCVPGPQRYKTYWYEAED